MPNRNYIKGRVKEYNIIKRLKEGMFQLKGEMVHTPIAQRTAGSHSPFDVVAVDPEKKIILLIQSKPESMSEAARKKLIEENHKLFNLNDEGIGLYFLKFVLE